MSSDDDVRGAVRAWLAEHWDPARDRAGWLAAVVDAGYAVPRWPRSAHGRDLSDEQAPHRRGRVRPRRRARAAARTGPTCGRTRCSPTAPTSCAAGCCGRCWRTGCGCACSTASRARGPTSPGCAPAPCRTATSTSSTGQKVWTSNAAGADYGMLLARTDPDVPKHRGLSFFFLPMDQPGVQVRPLRQITGEAHFNEVFLTGARVPAANLLGGPGQGWRVLLTALAYERVALGQANLGRHAPARTGGARPTSSSWRGGTAARTTCCSAATSPGCGPALGQPLDQPARAGAGRAGQLLAAGLAGQAGDVAHRARDRPRAVGDRRAAGAARGAGRTPTATTRTSPR